VADLQIDYEQVQHFLQALGKNGETRARGISAWKDWAKNDALDEQVVTRWQLRGANAYIVINDGGDDDESITACRAAFCEWDDRPTDWQVTAWKELNLPEPSLQVFTGGKSIHNYWIFDQPIAVEPWRALQQRLIAHAKSDKNLKNPSRVMRLPGTWHLSCGDQNPRVVVDQQAQIIHDSGLRYSLDQLDQAIPQLPTPTRNTTPPTPVPAPPTAGSVDLPALLSRDQKDLFRDGVQKGSRNSDCYRLACSLLAIEQTCSFQGSASLGFTVNGSAAQWLDDFNNRCSPPLPERELQSVLASAAQSNPEPDPGLPRRISYQQNELGLKRNSKNSPSTRHAKNHGDEPEDTRNSIAEQLGLSQRLADGRKIFTLEGLLPADLANAVALISAPLPTDPLAAALALLTGFSGLLKLGTFVSSSVSHRVPANLYLALVAPSGVAKTSVKRALVDDPAVEIRRDAAHEHKRAKAAWQEENKGKKKDEKTLAPRPIFPHLGNYTPAALSLQLVLDEARGLGQLVIVDELSGLLQSIEADTQRGSGSATAQLLEAFDGSGFTSIRVEAEPRSYESCHLSIFGNVQPDVLRSLVNGDDATGTFARFLFCRLPLVPLQLNDDDPTPDQWGAFEQAQQLLKSYASRLFALPPRTYCLSKQARSDFHSWFHRYQKQALAPGQSNVVSALLGKSSAHALRLAGLLHILRVASGDLSPDELISADTMITAMAVVDQLIDETIAFHESPDSDASLLARHIHQLSLDLNRPITRQEARNKGGRPVRRICTAPAFQNAIEELEQLGFGLIEEQPNAVSGRSKSSAYKATKPLPA
jgi:hypothetical protein